MAAKSLLREAVDLVEQVGDTFLCARSLTRLGTAEQGEGNPHAAIAWLEMDIRSRLGRAYLATGRLREAGEQFQAVLDVRAHDAR
ncbi:hypothetical protein [Streptomyces sp. HC307]|uniref:hypothetical protein n=1 Tax=Streptomyces flavusporus TaxID=3385496 RepID=UPI003916E179